MSKNTSGGTCDMSKNTSGGTCDMSKNTSGGTCDMSKNPKCFPYELGLTASTEKLAR